MSSASQYIPKVVDLNIFFELKKQNQEYIIAAEQQNADSLFYVSRGFITGENSFSKNVEIGIKYLVYGAEHGIPKAIEEYKQYFIEGQITSEDEEKAVINLNLIATKEQDSQKKNALYQILFSHESFDIHSTANEDVNYFLAKQICKESAELGNEKALLDYAKICLMHQKNRYGEIRPNFRKSLKCFEFLSEKGYPDAMSFYGIFLEKGMGGATIDIKKAIELYKKSYEIGGDDNASDYGYHLIQSGKNQSEVDEGIRIIKRACDRNVPSALTTYGFLIDLGIGGLEEDEDKSLIYYRRAAKLGHPVSFNNIGNFYKRGIVVQQDIQMAIKYLEFASKRGSLLAAKNLGNLYGDQQYGVFDKKKATKYLKYAIKEGSRPALSDYCCFLLLNHNGNQDDLTELRKYLQFGIQTEELETMELLGALYLDGGVVYEKNMNLGIEIYKKCAEMGSKSTIEELIKIYEFGEDIIAPDPVEAQKYRNMLENIKKK